MSEFIYYINLKSHIKTVTSLELEYPLINDKPFIPAFLVRNKLKNLLNIYYGFESYHKCNSMSCFLCLLFGSEESSCTTRLSVSDGILLKKDREKSFYDIKFTGNGPVYRICSNTIFEINFLYKIFDNNGDNGKRDTENFKYLLEGFSLIEDDYIGKNGTRGSGKIVFSNHFLHLSKKGAIIDLPSDWTLIPEEGKEFAKLVRNKSL